MGFRFTSNAVPTLPEGATAGALRIYWNADLKMWLICGWMDFPTTVGYDPGRKFSIPLPEGFPQVTSTSYDMMVPCVTAALGVIYGSLLLNQGTRTVDAYVPHDGISHIYWTRIPLPYT